MLTHLGRKAEQWVDATNPWTNVYGLSRSLLALSTVLTLVFTESDVLFGPAGQSGSVTGRRMIWFALFPTAHPMLARWSAVLVLLVIAAGWRPRVTVLPHWWITASFYDAALAPDGGDQIAAVLTLLILPIALTDSRVFHWVGSARMAPRERPLACLTASSAWLAVRVQIAVVYFQTLTPKIAVEEWRNGTAVYYWFTDPYYGAATWLKPGLMSLLNNPVGVTLMTWGSILIELALMSALVMPRRVWPLMLTVGLLFHCAIGIVQGLMTFSIAMSAALILYLRPLEKPFFHRLPEQR